MHAYDHYQTKILKKSFNTLREMGPYLRRLEDKELKLRVWVEDKLKNCTFFTWIESFNSRISYRQNLYLAINHWSKKSLQEHFMKWICFNQRRKNDKIKYRNFFMVKCIIEFLSRQVPRKVIKEQHSYRDLIQTLVDIRSMKLCD